MVMVASDILLHFSVSLSLINLCHNENFNWKKGQTVKNIVTNSWVAAWKCQNHGLKLFSFFFYFQNILEKFNPGARQLIGAGKAYLKALHGEFYLIVYLYFYLSLLILMFFFNTGAAAASRLFNEALAKIAVNAQQGGTTDIGEYLSCMDLFR